MSNTYGNILRLTTFGESHGACIGGVLDGFPAGVEIDEKYLSDRMRLRRPGETGLTSNRKETDNVELLSGIFEGKSTGAPIGFLIQNNDARSRDYSELKDLYRPSHADYDYEHKYGLRDYRGGGRSSARETACRVAAGAICSMALRQCGIHVRAFLSGAGRMTIPLAEEAKLKGENADSNPLFAPTTDWGEKMSREISEALSDGDSVGGRVTCRIYGAPQGLGEPLYSKLTAMLAYGMGSIGAVKGIEFGDGFALSQMRGSEALDLYQGGGDFTTVTNHCGGIYGGISHGGDITLRVGFKPTPTIPRDVATQNRDGESAIIHARGRHDPCVAVRGVQVVRAMAELTILDAFLMSRASKPF